MATIFCYTCKMTFPAQPHRSSVVYKIRCTNKFCTYLNLVKNTRRTVKRTLKVAQSLEAIFVHRRAS